MATTVPRSTKKFRLWMVRLLLAGWCWLSLQSSARAQTAGHVDPTFGASLGLAGSVQSVLVQSDGKVIVTGVFQRRIARLNPDGSQDQYFNSGTGPTSSVSGGGSIRTSAVQPDGKIILGGYFDSFSGVACNQMVRLNPDGSVDSGFNVGVASDSAVDFLALQADGKIIVVGAFSAFAGSARNTIARLAPDGSLDTTFNPGATINGYVGKAIVQPDRKIIIIGQFSSVAQTSRVNIARLNSDGSLDAAFNPGTGPANGSVYAVALQTDGKIIIGGGFTTCNGYSRKNIAQLNADGSVDNGFDPGLGPNTGIVDLATQSDGKVTVFGDFTTFAGTSRKYVARLKFDGTLDNTFDPGMGANGSIKALAMQSDGQILVGGFFSIFSGSVCNGLALLQVNGNVNTVFKADSSPGSNSPTSILAVQPDGRIVVAGSFTAFGGTIRNGIARLGTDGTLDTSFNAGTGTDHAGGTRGITVQPDGKIIVFGFFSSFNGITRKYVVRLTPNGGVDPGFDPGIGADNYGVNQVIVQGDGKLIVVGDFSTWNGVARKGMVRLNPDGTLDENFVYPSGYVKAAALQSNNKILVTVGLGVVRLNPNGTTDTTFQSGTGANNALLSLNVQADDKILVTGYFTTYNGGARTYIVRLNAGGTLDSSFNAGVVTGYYIDSVSLQADGKSIVTGNFSALGSTSRHNIARLFADGTLDVSYDPGSAFKEPLI